MSPPSSGPLPFPSRLVARARAWSAAFLADGWRAAAALLAWGAVASVILLVMAPWLKETHTFGFHDWDAQTSHRYLTVRTLLHYHQFPGWDPYACGGFPAWGYVEADTILVSPFLPFYLVLPMSLALRIEVLGMAILGAAGAYAAASRYAASPAARALVAVLWAVNGRWALQTASGHTWHLAYAFMPWCLFFFERAREPRRRVVDLAGGAVMIAMIVYSGGIYPLPHTVLLLGVYALILVVIERSARPLATLAIQGALGVALAAPKLLPLLDGFGKAPRLIESNETLDLGALLTLLTSRDQGFFSRPARVSPYGWHEWGMYIGVAGVAVLVLAAVFVQGRREAALKAVAAIFVVLGFGAFHPQAPWTWLHRVAPVFRSQHVPSRFLYTAVLVLALVAAAGIGRFLAARRAAWPWIEVVASALVLALAVDIGTVAQKPMTAAMWMELPAQVPTAKPFHTEQEPPFQYKRRDWAGPMYLAMLGNVGVINCYGTPPFDVKGAHPASAEEQVSVVSAETGKPVPGATATMVKWSPNRIIVDVAGAAPESLLVYDMNYDDGWRADPGPLVSFKHALAAPVPAGASQVTLKYRPPWLGAGLLAATIAAGALVLLRRRERRAEA